MMLGLQRLRCRRVRHALWDFVAERLSEGSLEMVERHISTCAACRRETEAIRRAQALLANYRQESIPAPRSDWYALRTRLQTETPVASHVIEERRPRLHTPIRQFERPLAPHGSRWAHSLGRSSAVAILLLLAAFGYRTLHGHIPLSRQQEDTATSQLEPLSVTKAQARAMAGSAPQTAAVTNSAGTRDVWEDFSEADMSADTASVRAIGALRPHNAAAQGPLMAMALKSFAVKSDPLAFAGLRHHTSHTRTHTTGNTPHFRHYQSRPGDALPATSPDRNRDEDLYVVNSVVPADNRRGGYVTPYLQPVPSDRDAPY
jgi:anti-sigma factor RsiW